MHDTCDANPCPACSGHNTWPFAPEPDTFYCRDCDIYFIVNYN